MKKYLVSLRDNEFKVESLDLACCDSVASFPATQAGWKELESWMEERKVTSFSANSDVHEWLVERDI